MVSRLGHGHFLPDPCHSPSSNHSDTACVRTTPPTASHSYTQSTQSHHTDKPSGRVKRKQNSLHAGLHSRTDLPASNGPELNCSQQNCDSCSDVSQCPILFRVNPRHQRSYTQFKLYVLYNFTHSKTKPSACDCTVYVLHRLALSLGSESSAHAVLGSRTYGKQRRHPHHSHGTFHAFRSKFGQAPLR
jgi:hypothetical protein